MSGLTRNPLDAAQRNRTAPAIFNVWERMVSRAESISLFARYASAALAVLAIVFAAFITAGYGSAQLSSSQQVMAVFSVIWLLTAASLGALHWRLRPVQRSLLALALIACCLALAPRHNCGPSNLVAEAC